MSLFHFHQDQSKPLHYQFSEENVSMLWALYFVLGKYLQLNFLKLYACVFE